MWGLLAGAVLVGALPQLAGSPSDRAAFPGRNGLIVFESVRGRGSQLFTVDLRGRVTQLTETGGPNSKPVWSRDGRTLAAYMPGTSLRQASEIVSSPVKNPSWAPDGQRVAGEGCVHQQCGVIIVDLATGARELIFQNQGEGSGRVEFFRPAWSPGGRWLAANYWVGHNPEPSWWGIEFFDLEQKRRRTLHHGVSPAWSPNGQLVAFTGLDCERVCAWSIFTARPNGTQRRRIARRRAWQPTWSPDGKKIAFVGMADGNREIFVINVNGTQLRRLTRNRSRDLNPDWQRRPG